jgi:tetratricopeptide (TPR) repeat protein
MAELEFEQGEPQPEAGGAQPLTESAGVAAALSLGKSSRDKEVNAETAAFLRDQRRLIGLQMEHLHEQRELQLSRLRWGRFSDRVRAGLQLMTALVGLLVAIAVGAAMWTAARSNSVVVDAFESPPALAAQGLNGTVVASGVLDELHRLQSATRVESAKRGVTNAWSGEIKVEVPETGISISELMRVLRAWLGHETHIGGELVQTPAGVRLTVRGDGIEAKSFDGALQDLPKLQSTAAEYIYGQAEPYIAASYMVTHGRDAEAIQLIESKYAASSAAERPFLLNAWGNALLDFNRVPEALAHYREAVRLKSDFWIAYNNVIASEWALGHEEEAWRTGVAFERKSGRGGPGHKAPEQYFQNLDIATWNLPAMRKALVEDMDAHGGVGGQLDLEGPSVAEMDTKMHDPAGAELFLETTADVDKDPFSVAMTHFVHGLDALDRNDWGRAATEMEAFSAGYANPAVSTEVPGYDCWLAPAEEMAGHPDKADAAVTAGGHFVDCYRFRADILDHRGDWSGAQKAYAAAVELAPDLPAAYYSWGLALARRGDLNGADARFAQANARGPHWADPLKAWGDALAAQGRLAEAEAKYAEAAQYAPKWKALHMAWGEALRRDGKYAPAIAQFHEVAG